jgi:hypothetical protein
MAAASLLSWLVAALLGSAASLEMFWGMIGPLAAASVTWLVAARAYRTHPERVTRLMIAAFGAKMLFFGAYVTLALTALPLRPVPFVVSFTCYFIAMHVTEAVCLRRLFTGKMNALETPL